MGDARRCRHPVHLGEQQLRSSSVLDCAIAFLPQAAHHAGVVAPGGIPFPEVRFGPLSDDVVGALTLCTAMQWYDAGKLVGESSPIPFSESSRHAMLRDSPNANV